MYRKKRRSPFMLTLLARGCTEKKPLHVNLAGVEVYRKKPLHVNLAGTANLLHQRQRGPGSTVTVEPHHVRPQLLQLSARLAHRHTVVGLVRRLRRQRHHRGQTCNTAETFCRMPCRVSMTLMPCISSVVEDRFCRVTGQHDYHHCRQTCNRGSAVQIHDVMSGFP